MSYSKICYKTTLKQIILLFIVCLSVIFATNGSIETFGFLRFVPLFVFSIFLIKNLHVASHLTIDNSKIDANFFTLVKGKSSIIFKRKDDTWNIFLSVESNKKTVERTESRQVVEKGTEYSFSNVVTKNAPIVTDFEVSLNRREANFIFDVLSVEYYKTAFNAETIRKVIHSILNHNKGILKSFFYRVVLYAYEKLVHRVRDNAYKFKTIKNTSKEINIQKELNSYEKATPLSIEQ